MQKYLSTNIYGIRLSVILLLFLVCVQVFIINKLKGFSVIQWLVIYLLGIFCRHIEPLNTLIATLLLVY